MTRFRLRNAGTEKKQTQVATSFWSVNSQVRQLLALILTNFRKNQGLSGGAVKLKARQGMSWHLGFLDRIEKGIERVVTSAFSKTFKSELQPIEIGSAIRSEMDGNASVVSRDRILVPNKFEITLSASDFARINLISERLNLELRNQAAEHAKKQGYQFSGALTISVGQSENLGIGQVHVKTSSSNATAKDVEWLPRLEVLGDNLVFEIQGPRTSVGRDQSADVQINDAGLSRKHFELLWDGQKASIRDLGSTNGTFIGGLKVREVALPMDSVIRAGNKSFVFKIVAKAVTS